LLVDIPLDKIETNPYNPRFNFADLDDLIRSLETNGQLSPIRVRLCVNRKYQLVFGHRRLMAAKKLEWKTIRAEVVTTSEEKMAIESLIENLDRSDLSDYEKGVMFDRMKNEFGSSFAEIGRQIGLSRQHVANFAAMANLFNPERLSRNPELREVLFKISEHHARILLSVIDEDSRMDLALRTARDGLTVRDLSNIVGRLRSWFPRNQFQEGSEHENSCTPDLDRVESDGSLWNEEYGFMKKEEYAAISSVIHKIFEFAGERNYKGYKRFHLFRNGFTMFSAFPPLQRLQGKQAISRENEWFHEIAPRFLFKIQDLKIVALDPFAALSTFAVLCFERTEPTRPSMKMVATMVLRKRGGEWAIFHEHWTKISLSKSEFLDTETDSQELTPL
jgi:ParB/RepB/Spo0J family partition protein